MPYKDPIKAKEKSKVYALAYRCKRKATKEPNSCSACYKPVDDPQFKKCSFCRTYMQSYKKSYRARPRFEGQCSGTDCKNVANDGFRRCLSCREKFRIRDKLPKSRAARKSWIGSLKPLVVEAYGGRCICCGEQHVELLSIDHIKGYSGGPRSGPELYSWLIQREFPKDGFRLLCITCNFTLGHHAYCPHGNLTQVKLAGRPVVGLCPSENKRKKRRAYTISAYKIPAFNAYGGAKCICCGETHLECLSLDHIDQNGAEHRRADKTAQNLYIWVKKNGYPEGFRVLCHGCNWALGKYGSCPHNNLGVRESNEDVQCS